MVKKPLVRSSFWGGAVRYGAWFWLEMINENSQSSTANPPEAAVEEGDWDKIYVVRVALSVSCWAMPMDGEFK